MSVNFHYLLKYVIIGDSGVGKSNILLRYINNTFSEEFKTTVGVEFGEKNIEINKKIYRIQIWDTLFSFFHFYLVFRLELKSYLGLSFDSFQLSS